MATSVIDDMKIRNSGNYWPKRILFWKLLKLFVNFLENEKISRKELADRLGKSKGFISQLLNGGRNLTLRTVADILHVLGYKVTLTPYKEGAKRQESQDNVIEFTD